MIISEEENAQAQDYAATVRVSVHAGSCIQDIDAQHTQTKAPTQHTVAQRG